MTTSSYQANRELVTLWVRSTPEEGETVKVHIFEQWEYDTSPKDWKIYYQGCSTISRVLIGREVWSKMRELSMEKTWSQRNYILSFSNRKQFFTVCTVKPRANGRKLHVASVCKPYCTLLHAIAQSLKPDKRLAQCWELLRPLARSLTDHRNDVKMLKPLAAFTWVLDIKSRANGHKIVGCYMLPPFAHPVACCCVLLGVVAQSLKPVKLLAACKRTQ